MTATGEQIATPDYDSRSWIAATVPGTVLASYINIGAVPNPNYADDVDQISESFFRSNFWYRDTFEVPAELCDGRLQWLCFDGINWKAMVYLNGVLLGRIDGAFRRGKFNVTGMLKKGTNCLAVKIICNDHFAAIKEKDEQTTQFNGGLLGADNPTFHATVGWDWITTVRGREAGIWNEVYLTTTGTADVSDPYVKTELSADGTYTTPAINADTRLTVVYAEGSTGLTRIYTDSQPEVRVTDGGLMLNSLSEGDRVEVYTLDGHRVYTSNATGAHAEIPVAPNKVYIIRINDQTFKVCL